MAQADSASTTVPATQTGLDPAYRRSVYRSMRREVRMPHPGARRVYKQPAWQAWKYAGAYVKASEAIMAAGASPRTLIKATW